MHPNAIVNKMTIIGTEIVARTVLLIHTPQTVHQPLVFVILALSKATEVQPRLLAVLTMRLIIIGPVILQPLHATAEPLRPNCIMQLIPVYVRKDMVMI